MQAARQQVGNASRKVEAPPGNQQYLDPAFRCFGNGAQILRGQLRGAIEQRPVDIHSNKLDRHTSIVP
jgi:hypothetical protein